VVSYLIVLLVLAGALATISGPLRAARRDAPIGSSARTAELEAARDAKYQEIRDAEMDVRTGKLSDEDYQAIDNGLRAEAVQILHRLDDAQSSDGYHHTA
jgi:hypothetical protein